VKPKVSKNEKKTKDITLREDLVCNQSRASSVMSSSAKDNLDSPIDSDEYGLMIEDPNNELFHLETITEEEGEEERAEEADMYIE
jgi:hypothetical protein